jgi:hypothetical protein
MAICTIPETIMAPWMVRMVRSKRSDGSAMACSSALKMIPNAAGRYANDPP